jgi:heat shock protein HtpX
MPRLFLRRDSFPNAAATYMWAPGTLTVHDGCLQFYSQRELSGVLAHEVGHLLHRDSQRGAVAIVLGSLVGQAVLWGERRTLAQITDHPAALVMVSSFFMIGVYAGLFVLFQQFRQAREYAADATAADLCGVATVIEGFVADSKNAPREAWDARRPGIRDFLASHPRTHDRIERLMNREPDKKNA